MFSTVRPIARPRETLASASEPKLLSRNGSKPAVRPPAAVRPLAPVTALQPTRILPVTDTYQRESGLPIADIARAAFGTVQKTPSVASENEVQAPQRSTTQTMQSVARAAWNATQKAPRSHRHSLPSRVPSSGSVCTISSVSSASWDVLSAHTTRVGSPASWRAAATPTSPLPQTPTDNGGGWYFAERDMSSARVGIAMATTECDVARTRLRANTSSPSRRSVKSLLAVDTLRLNYYRDYFACNDGDDYSMVGRMWNEAIRPIVEDIALYARFPALQCTFLQRAYDIYGQLTHDSPRYERDWNRARRDVAAALVPASRAALDSHMETYISPECGEDTVTRVARSYLDVERWQRAVRELDSEMLANDLLAASLNSLTEACVERSTRHKPLTPVQNPYSAPGARR